MSAVVLLRKLSHVHPTAAVILTTTKNAQLLSLSLSNKFTENRRKMSGFLIDEPKYAFLKELGIEKRNHGVFNGTWGGSGDVSHYFFYICLHFYRASKWEISLQGNVIKPRVQLSFSRRSGCFIKWNVMPLIRQGSNFFINSILLCPPWLWRVGDELFLCSNLICPPSSNCSFCHPRKLGQNKMLQKNSPLPPSPL